MIWDLMSQRCPQTLPHQSPVLSISQGELMNEAGTAWRVEFYPLTSLNARCSAKHPICVSYCHSQLLHDLVVIASLIQQKTWAQNSQVICPESHSCYRVLREIASPFPNSLSLRLNTDGCCLTSASTKCKMLSRLFRTAPRGLQHLLPRGTGSVS